MYVSGTGPAWAPELVRSKLIFFRTPMLVSSIFSCKAWWRLELLSDPFKVIHAGVESIIEDSQVLWPEVGEVRTLNFLSLSALFYGHCSLSTALKLLTHTESKKDQENPPNSCFFPFFSFFCRKLTNQHRSQFSDEKKIWSATFCCRWRKKSRFAFLDDPSSFAKKYRSASLSENQFSLFFVIVER